MDTFILRMDVFASTLVAVSLAVLIVLVLKLRTEVAYSTRVLETLLLSREAGDAVDFERLAEDTAAGVGIRSTMSARDKALLAAKQSLADKAWQARRIEAWQQEAEAARKAREHSGRNQWGSPSSQLRRRRGVDTMNSPTPSLAATEPVIFEEGGSCSVCSAAFTTLMRRHHCRECGRSCCGVHSEHERALPWRGQHAPVRVCDHCTIRLDGEASAAAARRSLAVATERRAALDHQLGLEAEGGAALSLVPLTDIAPRHHAGAAVSVDTTDESAAALTEVSAQTAVEAANLVTPRPEGGYGGWWWDARHMHELAAATAVPQAVRGALPIEGRADSYFDGYIGLSLPTGLAPPAWPPHRLGPTGLAPPAWPHRLGLGQSRTQLPARSDCSPLGKYFYESNCLIVSYVCPPQPTRQWRLRQRSRNCSLC
eukprot:SAG11_NODE_839_length_6916_cov_7.427314_5_plen_427_part_00